jgi:flap endonuclease-1
MGIKNLNRYLRTECKKSINKIHMSQLSGKKIVIDTSIYLYKFLAEDCLIENMYLMLSIFNHYNIIPLFIFDGIPPDEKKKLLLKRQQEKTQAKIEYEELKKTLNKDENNLYQIQVSLDLLKKKFIHITKEQVKKVKELITVYGGNYLDADGEADELCAWYVLQNEAHLCLSDDMDMFVYGCPRVLRYFSLLAHSGILYEYSEMLSELQMNTQEFTQICVLAGTDYNEGISVDTAFNYFKEFKEFKINNNCQTDFYIWISQKKMDTFVINNEKYYDDLNIICDRFNLNNRQISDIIKISKKNILFNKMKILLEEFGFIFT